jgi:hypothetical protein
MSDTTPNPSAKAGSAVQVRLHGPLYEALENWRRLRPSIPSRAVALRELLERALAEQQDATTT